MQVATEKVRVNGITLNILVAGKGPDVLLVHGFPDDHRVWRKTIPALVAAGYRVIAPDLRGFGESDAPPEKSAYKAANVVADLVALLDHLGIQKVRLVGHDWGAVISWHLASAHPERIHRYAALSVGHPHAYATGPLEQKLKGYYVLLFQLRGLADWALKWNDWKLFRLFAQFPEETPSWIAAMSRPGRLTAAMDYYRANIGMLVSGSWTPVRVPVMGIWSDGDIFLAERQMTDSRKYVTESFRYHRVEGANHWLQLTAPESVNSLLIDFLSGRDAPQSQGNAPI